MRSLRATRLVILAKRSLDEGVNLLHHYTERLSLRLNEEKTRRLKLNIGNSVDFLGFRFHNVRSRTTGTRWILVYPSPRSQERMRRKVRTLKGRRLYARRKAIVEPVIGQIKHAAGFRQFNFRGHPKVKAEWFLVSAGHNLRKLFRAIFQEPDRRELALGT